MNLWGDGREAASFEGRVGELGIPTSIQSESDDLG